VKEWLVDKGCGYDLVCRADIEKVKKYIEEGNEMIFETAGGEVPARDVIPLFLPHLQQHIRPHVLDSTPNVLSVGARCQEMGWWFVWGSWSYAPYFLDATGRKIGLVAEGNIPYLKTSSPALASINKPIPMDANLHAVAEEAKRTNRRSRQMQHQRHLPLRRLLPQVSASPSVMRILLLTRFTSQLRRRKPQNTIAVA
jgi:hypothetical protein